MRRRDFLRNVAATSATIGFPQIALADGLCGTGVWGEITCGDIWAGETPASKLLDIHITGGMAPFESFYFRPDGGRTRGFDPDVEALLYNNASTCGINITNPVFNHQDLTDDLGNLDLTSLDSYDDDAFLIGHDESNKPVHLGPFALPLRLHRKIWDCMRVAVLAHDLSPHEAAIPFALTGKRLGRPNFSCVGAPISRAQRALNGDGHPLPYSYALKAPFSSTFPAFGALDLDGGHGGANKPLVLKPGPEFDVFVNRLLRNNIDSDAMDNANAWYRAQYEQWLSHSGQRVRSPAFDDHFAAVEAMFKHIELHGLLESGPNPVADSTACTSQSGQFLQGSGISKTALNLAAHLLTRQDEESARYVAMVDEGLQHSGLMPAYDVHDTQPHVEQTSRNLWNMLSSLTSVVNDYGENNPNKINLEETMIVLSTEFGRTPYKSDSNQPDSGSVGRDHWPQGYAIMLIGGPIENRGVVGSLTDGVGVDAAIADIAYNPTDIRAACLLAQNIYPFEGDLYQVGSISPSLQGSTPATSHPDTMVNLRTKILGVS